MKTWMSERRLDRRTFLKGIAVGAGAVAAGWPVAAGASPRLSGTIKVGVLLPFTGPSAQQAQEHVNGSMLYLKMVGGTLNGMTVQLVKEDDQFDPSVGLQKAQKLVESARVDVTVGVASSAVALAVREYFDQSKAPLVITIASADEVTKQPSPYIVRISVGAWQNSYPLGAWAFKHVGKTALTMASNYAMGKEFTSGFAEAFTKAGGKIVGRIFSPIGTTDFAPFLSSVRGSDASFVWTSYGSSDALNFVKQYAQYGLNTRLPLIGVGHMVSNDVLPAEGRTALGIRTNYHWAPALDNPVNRRFVSTYAREYGVKPSPYAMYGYDAMQLVHRALMATQGDKSPDVLAAAMVRARLDSPRGSLTIDSTSHNVTLRQYLLEVQETKDGLDNVPLMVLGTYTDRAQLA
jgi:branched-chain amino acid transport system substrate-binding protein